VSHVFALYWVGKHVRAMVENTLWSTNVQLKIDMDMRRQLQSMKLASEPLPLNVGYQWFIISKYWWSMIYTCLFNFL
jgi:hypothetical protein